MSAGHVGMWSKELFAQVCEHLEDRSSKGIHQEVEALHPKWLARFWSPFKVTKERVPSKAGSPILGGEFRWDPWTSQTPKLEIKACSHPDRPHRPL